MTNPKRRGPNHHPLVPIYGTPHNTNAPAPTQRHKAVTTRHLAVCLAYLAAQHTYNTQLKSYQSDPKKETKKAPKPPNIKDLLNSFGYSCPNDSAARRLLNSMRYRLERLVSLSDLMTYIGVDNLTLSLKIQELMNCGNSQVELATVKFVEQLKSAERAGATEEAEGHPTFVFHVSGSEGSQDDRQRNVTPSKPFDIEALSSPARGRGVPWSNDDGTAWGADDLAQGEDC